MTCAEFRALWIEYRAGEPREALDAHVDTCPTCPSWAEREDALDSIFETALVVDPPPALAARLRQISGLAPAVAPAPSPWSYLPEVLVVAFIALGLLGLSGDTATAVGNLVLNGLGNLLLSLAVLLDSPLTGYLQNLWTTALGASAALLLFALLVTRALSYPLGRSTD